MEWSEVMADPFFQNIPFKVELNKWGKILMSPASNNHGYLQADLVYKLRTKLPKGKVITECSVQTSEGVKVADVAWGSDSFFNEHGFKTPYLVAPEICIEVVSPSNYKTEMNEKIELYLNQGAVEVWLCDQDGKIAYYSKNGKMDYSLEVGA